MERIVVLSSVWMSAVISSAHYTCPKDIRVDLVNVTIDNYKDVAIELEKQQKISAFVAAANTQDICKYVKAPVINVEISGFDLMSTLNQASKNKVPGEAIALLSYKRKLEQFSSFKGIIKDPVEEHVYYNIEDLRVKLQGLKTRGITRVVGTSIVQEKAQQLGMKGYIIYNVSSLTSAIERAIEILVAKKEEAEKADSLEKIFQSTYGGIIVADNLGIISKVNPFAQKLLKLPETELKGKHISSIFSGLDTTSYIDQKKPTLNRVYAYGESKFLINIESFQLKTQHKGIMISFQDVDVVQKSEIAIRRKLHEKGFDAKATFDNIVGISEKMQGIKRSAQKYARKSSTVLLLGETGVGKDLFAQAIHNASNRANGPFVAINCAALSPNLLQSELFGYEEHSFTGARRGGKPGLFELANNGTIFLDEIGEIDKNTQIHLLRVLETGEIMRVGGEKVIPVNVRVVAATNQRLWDLVECGAFREDLYYRLCVLEIRIPPLRERKEDIPAIAEVFLNTYCAFLPIETRKELSNSDFLLDYHWRGNIRELRNIVERFAAVYEGNEEEPETVLATSIGIPDGSLPVSPNITEDVALSDIQKVLQECGGNRTKAAERLGISRTTLWRKLSTMQ